MKILKLKQLRWKKYFRKMPILNPQNEKFWEKNLLKTMEGDFDKHKYNWIQEKHKYTLNDLIERLDDNYHNKSHKFLKILNSFNNNFNKNYFHFSPTETSIVFIYRITENEYYYIRVREPS